jgi:RNA polymerase sigma-70 factor, ECF subfamily
MNTSEIEVLRAFYVGSRQELYTYAVSVTGNRQAAEDIIQSIFEKLLRGRALPSDLRPYVFRSIRNAALDAWRRTKIRTDSIFDAAPPGDETASPAASAENDFEPFLQRLSPDERETIVLKIYGDFTFREIADLREAPLPTVASWYRRGLDRLKAMLNEES